MKEKLPTVRKIISIILTLTTIATAVTAIFAVEKWAIYGINLYGLITGEEPAQWDTTWFDGVEYYTYPLLTAEKAQQALILLIATLALAVVSLALFITMIVLTGKKRADGTRRMWALDKVFPEVQIAVIFAALMLFGEVWYWCTTSMFAFFRFHDTFSYYLALIACGTCMALSGLLGEWIVLSLVRNIKNKTFIKRCIIWIALKAIGRGLRTLFRTVKSGFDGTNPYAKTILLIAALWVATGLSSFVFLFAMAEGGGFMVLVAFAFAVAVIALAILFSIKQIRTYAELKKGIGELAAGNLKYRIPVPEDQRSEFANLAHQTNLIGAAQQIAVANELKSGRMKTDLIANVSHDIRTPLTSLLTYSDLLLAEAKSGKVKEYAQIIEEKSRRLEKLTEDLFDAAKASSGAVEINLDKIDLLTLLRQEVAEMNGGFESNSLELIYDTPEDHYYVMADSRLVWRVIDNLLTNVKKYALPGSRVYINMAKQNERVRLEIKNISKTMLNIPAEELMERFKRGEESRTETGSGLGLSIASDLTRLMGGTFEIKVDGDLFKVTITFPITEI
jgi:signal transduction histidine kinase